MTPFEYLIAIYGSIIVFELTVFTVVSLSRRRGING